MSVYLGCSGSVQLTRSSIEDVFDSVVNAADVQPNRNVFSFDFPVGQLITGDQLEIKAVDGLPLDFVTGWPHRDGKWYIHVDDVGGVGLYTDITAAINNDTGLRVDLQLPSRAIPIEVRVRNAVPFVLGNVTSFELNTERSAVDVTELGEEFVRQHATLITGSGSLQCFFDYRTGYCGDALEPGVELPVYLHQLVIRQNLGSQFHARLLLLERGAGRAPGDEVWYEFDALVTNAGIAFEPTQPVRSQIQFVTTGRISLHIRTESNYLTQENDSRIMLETNQGDGSIELEQQS